MHSIVTRPARHEVLRPESALKEHVSGLVRDRRAESTHDSGNADRSAVIGDYQRVVVEFDLFFIQQGHFFPWFGETRSNRTVQKGRVISMQRLRFGGRVDTPYQASRKSRATGRLDQFYRVRIVDRGGDWIYAGIFECGASQCGHVPGNAKDTEAIAAVRCEVQVNYRVWQAKEVDQWCADFRVRRKLHDSV